MRAKSFYARSGDLTSAGKILSVILMVVIFSAAVVITGPEVGAAESADVVVVRISGLAFTPAEIVVSPGTTVRWINDDPFAHDVTSGSVVEGRRARQVAESRLPDGKFHSGAYGKGHGFEFTFKNAGTYPYFCTIHPIMTGSVSVVR
ncbi:MAG: plastocyanin/azurin family copper-binding protein [Thermodesulfobacteriota bacterium]